MDNFGIYFLLTYFSIGVLCACYILYSSVQEWKNMDRKVTPDDVLVVLVLGCMGALILWIMLMPLWISANTAKYINKHK